MKALRGFLLVLLLSCSASVWAVHVRVCATDPGVGVQCPSGQLRWEPINPMTNSTGYFYHVPIGLGTYSTNVQYVLAATFIGQTQFFACYAFTASTCTEQRWEVLTINPTITSIASCVPAATTIAPCPTGMAPASIDPYAANAGNFSGFGDFGKLVLQDLIFAAGLAVSGLLGIGVGVRLL